VTQRQDIDPKAVRRAFSRAAPTYDAAAALQREVGARMAARLDYVKVAPALVLDAGCGTGEAVGELATRYAGARVVALDAALPMVAAAQERARHGRTLAQRLLPASWRHKNAPSAPAFVCGDMNELPFAASRFDLVWSNLALQWVNDLPRALAEIHRALNVGGLVTFSTFGPDTLREIRTAFATVDGHAHTSRFHDMHDVGDMLVHAGFADPVMDMEHLTLTYREPADLMRELKALGATNATVGRSRGLMGRARWQRALEALDRLRRDGRIPATYEVVYGHAWKVPAARSAEGLPVVRFERGRR
jgi:malonyl-CoA O-methyltransferase